MAGYSGTPLWKKLGIKEGDTVHVVGGPEHYAKLVAPLPTGARIGPAPARIVHLFCGVKADLAKLADAKAAIPPDGMVWISWPKKSSGIETDIDEAAVRAAGLAVGLVDTKICAVDETWSGLKFVYRLSDRPQR